MLYLKFSIQNGLSTLSGGIYKFGTCDACIIII